MKVFKDDVPIYLQLRRQVEEQILAKALKEDDQIKSFRALAAEYKINPITAANAINALVDEGILYHKRGIGIFVAAKAREKIIKTRRSTFIQDELVPALSLAKSYEVPLQDIIDIIKSIYGEKK